MKKLCLVAALAASAGTLLTATDSKADFTVCNHWSSEIWVFMGDDFDFCGSSGPYTTDNWGWYQIQAGACTTTLTGSVGFGGFYVHAHDDFGNLWGDNNFIFNDIVSARFDRCCEWTFVDSRLRNECNWQFGENNLQSRAAIHVLVGPYDNMTFYVRP